jgi:hypothetical protein
MLALRPWLTLERFAAVSSGERMKVTGACVATACLIERSMNKSELVLARDRDILDASELSTGRMVL